MQDTSGKGAGEQEENKAAGLSQRELNDAEGPIFSQVPPPLLVAPVAKVKQPLSQLRQSTQKGSDAKRSDAAKSSEDYHAESRASHVSNPYFAQGTGKVGGGYTGDGILELRSSTFNAPATQSIHYSQAGERDYAGSMPSSQVRYYEVLGLTPSSAALSALGSQDIRDFIPQRSSRQRQSSVDQVASQAAASSNKAKSDRQQRGQSQQTV